MTRALPRTNFHSSRLIRCLADLTLVDEVPPGNAFAQKLGLWLNFTDAIHLFAAHNADVSNIPGLSAPSHSHKPARLGDEVTRLRASLTQAISKSCMPSAAKGRAPSAAPAPDEPLDLAEAYEPFKRLYLAQQRDMELHIHPLRARVRERLALSSPALRRLAALDAAFDAILKEREGKLLAAVPSLLEQRFRQLGQSDQQATSWLTRFRTELQTVLLAELDLRLQPTVGLVEAYNNQLTPQQ